MSQQSALLFGVDDCKPDEYVHKHEHLPFCSSVLTMKKVHKSQFFFFIFTQMCFPVCHLLAVAFTKKCVVSCLTLMKNQRNHKSILLLKKIQQANDIK